jgi:hypothetical protein
MGGSVLPSWMEQDDSTTSDHSGLNKSINAKSGSSDEKGKVTVSPTVDVNGLPKISMPCIYIIFFLFFYFVKIIHLYYFVDLN